ncbi:hypothetical protein GCM10028798_25240 [Humibacter antri]
MPSNLSATEARQRTLAVSAEPTEPMSGAAAIQTIEVRPRELAHSDEPIESVEREARTSATEASAMRDA